MTGRSIITSSWITLQTVNEVYIIKCAILSSHFRVHYLQNTIQHFKNVKKKCRYIFDHMIIWQVLGGKANIFFPELKGI